MAEANAVSTFEEAAEKVKTLKETPTNEEQLEVYGLYKQATAGDNTNSQPWAINVTARSKHDAWAAHKGKSSEDAKAEYIAAVNKLIAKYGLSE